MADVLAASEGYEKTGDPAEADLILFNTCSVREKAQEKVFADLGRVKRTQAREPGVLIGVGGCVASQEGAEIVQARALRRSRLRPADAASPARAPRRVAATPASRRSTSPSPRSRSSTTCRPARVEGASAFVSIMEGCSKYCSFCVVPYTRGEEVSRPIDDVLARSPPPRLARREGSDPPRAERERVRGRARPTASAADFALLLAHVAEGRGHRAHPLHHVASARIHAAPDRRVHAASRSWSRRCTCRCSRARTASSPR